MKDAFKHFAQLCVFWTGDSGPLTISWAKEQGILPADRAVDDGNGVLIITQVQTTDSGTYVCTASAGQIVVSDKTQLTVDSGAGGGGAGQYDSGPVVTINPQYRCAD